MYHLADVFPKLRNVKFPLSRDQFVLLFVAANEIILGVDIFLAHSISGTIVPNEWIPIIFGPVAGILLLVAGAIALRRRNLATILGSIVFFTSIFVGVLGSYFHVRRAFLMDASLLTNLDLNLLVWAPPLLGPLSFTGIGILGMVAVMKEEVTDSGVLLFYRGKKLRLPLSKTNVYLILVSLGILATLISSVLDHARTGFENPWLWLPTAIGVFAIIASFILADEQDDPRSESIVTVIAMVLLILVGTIGFFLHIQTDLTANFEIVQERFLRGAPFLAPLLYCNMGLIGLMVMLDPEENK